MRLISPFIVAVAWWQTRRVRRATHDMRRANYYATRSLRTLVAVGSWSDPADSQRRAGDAADARRHIRKARQRCHPRPSLGLSLAGCCEAATLRWCLPMHHVTHATDRVPANVDDAVLGAGDSCGWCRTDRGGRGRHRECGGAERGQQSRGDHRCAQGTSPLVRPPEPVASHEAAHGADGSARPIRGASQKQAKASTLALALGGRKAVGERGGRRDADAVRISLNGVSGNYSGVRERAPDLHRRIRARPGRGCHRTSQGWRDIGRTTWLPPPCWHRQRHSTGPAQS